jgi:hypothetical protein
MYDVRKWWKSQNLFTKNVTVLLFLKRLSSHLRMIVLSNFAQIWNFSNEPSDLTEHLIIFVRCLESESVSIVEGFSFIHFTFAHRFSLIGFRSRIILKFFSILSDNVI